MWLLHSSATPRKRDSQGPRALCGFQWDSVSLDFDQLFGLCTTLNRKTNSPAADAANASRRLEALSAEFEASEARSFELEGARRCFMRVFVPL